VCVGVCVCVCVIFGLHYNSGAPLTKASCKVQTPETSCAAVAHSPVTGAAFICLQAPLLAFAQGCCAAGAA